MGNSQFSDFQITYIGAAKNLAMQKYTHAYLMWNSIDAGDCIWVQFKAHFQASYLYREELEHTSRVACYGSAKNVKYGKMEDAFMNLASDTAAKDADFTKLTTINGNLSTQLRQQEDKI